MKIKRFNNLWTMGLILFGAILVLFYIAKIFFPEFIVGVAEIPSIVAFGNFIDSHLWAYYLYNFVIGFIGGYIYCCACCKVTKLSFVQFLILVGFLLIGIFWQIFEPSVYTPYNYTILILMPFVMCLTTKSLGKDTFTSTSICFSIDIMAQALSAGIRNIFSIATFVNSATITILVIDLYIWRALLYCFSNYKNKEKES